MQEQIRPLEIAFMGRNLNITNLFLRQFAEDNEEQVAHKQRGRLVLKDGTRIEAVSPHMVQMLFDGRRYDQLILADDTRGILGDCAVHEIEVACWYALRYSCVPEEFQILRYNVDAPAPPKYSVKIESEGLEEFKKAMAAVGIAAEAAAEAFRKLSEAAREYAPEGQKRRRP